MIASPRNADENSAVQKIASHHGSYAVIGITDIETEGTFKYPSGELMQYSNWANNEPNNASDKEDCIELITGGFWNDMKCDNEKLIICEY